MGIPPDQNRGAQPMSEILHIRNQIVCYIKTYCIYLFITLSSVVTPIETGILKNFVYFENEMCALT